MQNNLPHLPKVESTAKKPLLSSNDLEQIRSINSEIKTVPQHIVDFSFDDIIKTLQDKHQLNRIVRDEHKNIIAYLGCQDDNNGGVYIKYLAASNNSLSNIRGQILNFIVRAKKLQYKQISFHGFNPKLNKLLSSFGFVEKSTGFDHSHASEYVLNLQETSPDLLSSRQVKKYITYLSTDTNAKEVWLKLNREERFHIIKLLSQEHKQGMDPKIHNLYGAINTLIKNNIPIIDIKKYKSYLRKIRFSSKRS